MHTTPRRYTGIVWGVLLGLTLLWCFLILRPQPQLLDRATLLLPAEEWRRDYTGYFWQSNHEILFAKDDPGSGVPKLFRADTENGTQTPLTRLNAAWKPPLDSQTWRLSPDGKWLLARSLRPGGMVYTAYALDGSRKVSWPAGQRDEMSILWMPDSRRWVGFERAFPTMSGRRLPLPVQQRRMFALGQTSLAAQPILHSLDGPDTKGALITGPFSWPLGTTPMGGVRTGEQGATRIDFYEYGLDPKAAFVRHFTVPLAGISVVEVEPSPNGGRIAFLTTSPMRNVTLQSLFETFFPAARRRNNNRFALWVCRADGSGLHEIGSERGVTLAGVQWSPDGKRISFFGRHALYTVPAD